jgi:hypothetical protein
MRNLGSRSAAFGLGLLAFAAVARADDVAGFYEVQFDQVSTNCEHPIAYPAHGSVKIDIKGNDLQIDIERTPLMLGKPAGNGKVSAKSRPGHTPIEGMDGVFSVAGKVNPDGVLSLVMIGEYQAAGKPLCTQSWNLSGLRGKPDKSGKAGADKPKR